MATPPTFQVALVPVTEAEYRGQFLGALAALPGSNVHGWSSGAPQRGFLNGEARAMAANSSIVAALAATASPTTILAAGSSWVDAKVGWFDLDNGQGGKGRFPATFAVWDLPVQITPATNSLTVDGSNASAIVVQAANGTIFLCTQVAKVVINSASSYKGTIQVTARVAGTTGNVTIGSIVAIVSAPAGMSIDLGETQFQTSTARNQETDQEYINRGLGEWGKLSVWTLTGFDYYIPLFGNNGTTLNVTRWGVDDSNPMGPGTVAVYLGNAAGPASAPEVAAVLAGLDGPSVHPLGSGQLFVSAAADHHLTINIYLRTDGSNALVYDQCAAAVDTLIKAFPAGPATLEVDLVSAVARGAPLVSATIPAGAASKVIALNLPGFSSVEQATTVDIFGGLDLLTGEIFTATITVQEAP